MVPGSMLFVFMYSNPITTDGKKLSNEIQSFSNKALGKWATENNTLTNKTALKFLPVES